MSINEAIQNNNIELYKQSLERGVDINKQHRFGREEWYPVYAAVRFGRVEILEDMIDRGVDLTVKVDGRSLLWYSDKKEITKLLLKNSEINLEERAKYGGTVFMRNISESVSSVDNDSLDNAKYLFSMGADINAQDNKGNTALHKMLQTADDINPNYNESILKAISFLLKNGSDFYRKNSAGEAPADMLEDFQNPAVKALVTDHIEAAREKISVFEKKAGNNLNQDVLDKIASHVIGANTDSYLQRMQKERAQAASKDDGKGRW